MRRAFSLAALLLTTAASAGTHPAVPPAKPVTETFFGTAVTDNYRYFEDLKDPAVIGWMKAEGAYTRSLFDSIPGRAALAGRVAAFTGSIELVKDYQRAGDRDFYQQRGAGADAYNLMVRDAAGTRTLIDAAAVRKARGGVPVAINYYSPSPDGKRVAVGISEGGSEDASLYIYDVATGQPTGATLPRIRFGPAVWSNDSTTLYANQLKALPPGSPPTATYQNSIVLGWQPGSAPVPVLGNGVGSNVTLGENEFPVVAATPGAAVKRAVIINGVQNEIDIWTAPDDGAATAATKWTRVVAKADGITQSEVRGDTIYLLSHADAPTFKVLAVKAGAPLSSAVTVVPANPKRLIEGIRAASDGLYVMSREGLFSRIDRIDAAGKSTPVALPRPGSVDASSAFADPTAPGVTVIFDSWTQPPKLIRYDPSSARFADTGLGKAPPGYDPTRYVETVTSARAKDGVAVPLSIFGRKGATGPRPVLLEAYGSYGISNFPYFSTRRTPVMDEGITYAMCHVRGGGELGEAWRLGGKDANKPNTWRDLIACGDALVKQGVTTPKQLFIIGGSAGGITMGRSMEERPDLFAGVIDQVPAANTLRAEFSANGPPNIPEFGTVKTADGFRNLLAMDSIHHIKDGVAYPPIMIATGLNDPRVEPWEPAKLAARMRTANPSNIVLLRIEEAAGHGIGSTRAQGDGATADTIAFINWRIGKPGWTPLP